MSWRRVSLPGKALTPYEKWSSLKVGDVVTDGPANAEPIVLVSVQRFKQTYGQGPNKQTVY